MKPCETCIPEPLYLPGRVIDPVTGTVMPLASPWSEPIPRFLRRADWTEEEWAAHHAAKEVGRTLQREELETASRAPGIVMPEKRRRRRKKEAKI